MFSKLVELAIEDELLLPVTKTHIKQNMGRGDEFLFLSEQGDPFIAVPWFGVGMQILDGRYCDVHDYYATDDSGVPRPVEEMSKIYRINPKRA